MDSNLSRYGSTRLSWRVEQCKVNLQCRHLITALNPWVGILTDRTLNFLEHGCMDDLTTERSFDSQATLVIDVLGLFFDMLSMTVCINKHWQTSGRLVQELNSRTVSTFFLKPYLALWCFYSRQHKNRTDCFYSFNLL